MRPDVAVVFTHGSVTFPDAPERSEIQSRPTFIATKDNGEWRTVAFQNTRISEMPGEATEAKRLAR